MATGLSFAANSDQDVLLWCSTLGVPAAPRVRHNLSIALGFFRRWMPGLDIDMAVGFLRGMDLHDRIEETQLARDEKVAAFRRAGESLFKLYYTKAGTSVHQLGVVPNNRAFHRFRVCSHVVALKSRAASFIYAAAGDLSAGTPSWAAPGGGGGVQFIIPDADRVLVAESSGAVR